MPIPAPDPRRFLIVSDFHLTSGKDAVTFQWSNTEDFFWDEEFAEFLFHHTDATPTTLVVNGDLVDFMQVNEIPTPKECADFDISPEEISTWYGLRCSERAADFQAERVIRGHYRLFEALALFVGHGNQVVILTGNHDIQLYWPAVQSRIRNTLRTICEQKRLPFSPDRLRFHPWCYYIPDLLYVEHGNQYEATTAFRNIFIPILPFDLPNGRKQIDLDLSGFLVRYVTNRVEPVNPLADNVRPLSEYYRHLWKTHPWHAVRTFLWAAIFVFLVFRKRRLWRKDEIRRRYAGICRQNIAGLHKESQRWSSGRMQEAERIAKMFQKIRTRYHEQPAFESGIWRFLKKGDELLPDIFHILRLRAEQISEVCGTRYVVFGHSHLADSHQLPHGRRYFNTGSWIPTFTTARPEQPDPLQFSFLRIENGEARLMRWNPASHSAETLTFQ
jgi:UDP-2,3-diacylglucosamine pyrophosphatase LpxH